MKMYEFPYGLGDTVFVGTTKTEWRQVFAPGHDCELCEGTGFVYINEFKRHCPDRFAKTHKQVQERRQVPDVRGPFTVVKVEIVRVLPEYDKGGSYGSKSKVMCAETGCPSGSCWYEEKLGRTYDEAMRKAEKHSTDWTLDR